MPPGQSTVKITELPTDKVAYEVDCALRALTRNRDDHNNYTGTALVYLKELTRRCVAEQQRLKDEWWAGYAAAIRDAETAIREGRATLAWAASVRSKFGVEAEQEGGLSEPRESSKHPPAELRCNASAPNIVPALRCTHPSGHGQVHVAEDGPVWVGDEPYPASEQLLHLASATRHLLHEHDCDHQGYETWSAALRASDRSRGVSYHEQGSWGDVAP